ncbi:calcium-binding protein [Gymnodinialimonas ulvae]|uniref:calcium-binding protein n=1 Tax=Gymnodinialimonas ulvae TaxID=3126504 RepID=UPI0030A3DB4D
MTQHQIGYFESTGNLSQDGHFNVNILPAANTGEPPWGGNESNALGSPTVETIAALDEFRVDYTRFPAGQEKEFFSEHGIIVNGQLTGFLAEYLTFAQANGMQISLVLPVETLEPFGGVGVPELYTQLQTMAELIGDAFPGVVKSYELGNEYWRGRASGDESREVDYGNGAAQAALALQAGMDASRDNPAILLQASGNLAGSYDNSISGANAAIQSAFSGVVDPNGLIDGILRNFYWRDAAEGELHDDSGLFLEDRGLGELLDGGATANWEDWAGTDLLRVVGEFNINRNIALSDDQIDIGIHGASFILEHYTNLVEADVDYSFAWPIIHSTQNAYINRHEDIVTETVNGYDVVVNSTRAAMFDILGEVTVGLALMETDWNTTEGTGSLELTVFSNAMQPAELGSRSEIFLSSRSAEAQHFTVDLSMISSESAQRFAYVVGYEQTGGNHRNADLRELDLNAAWQNGNLEIYLRPYEVLHITSVEFAPDDTQPQIVNVYEGTSEDDFQLGIEGADSMEGHSGDDVLIGEDGDDLVFGAAGHDTLLGSAGDDELSGGAGNDVVDGGQGNDTASGGDGADTILGHEGRDVLPGDAGNDFLVGGVGDDTLEGGAGYDVLHGQADDDLLFGGSGNDSLFGEDGFDFLDGGIGDDLLIGGGNSDTLSGGDGNDELIGDWGFDVLMGGDGADTLNGGSGADTMTGGAGADDFYFNAFDDRLDRVTDFTIGEDRLAFDTSGFGGEFAGVSLIAYDSGASTILRFIGADSSVDKTLGGIVLEGVASDVMDQVDYFAF